MTVGTGMQDGAAERPTVPASDPHSLAARLNALFRYCRPLGHEPLTYVAAAAAITAATGKTITHTTLWALRTGRQTNPQIDTLRAIAEFFGVPVAYFVATERDLRYLTPSLTIDPAHLRVLADLSPPGQAHIAQEILATAWREAEHSRSTPPADPESPQ